MKAPFVQSPLEELSLDALQQRSSQKWLAYPSDVLPLFVAEMDVPLAEPVQAAIIDAVKRGDTGYPAGTAYAEALAAFATDRWQWEPQVRDMRLVPDVMLGIVEVLELISAPGDTVIVNPPVYPPFYDFVTHAGRQVAEAPLGKDGRLDLGAIDEAMRSATARGSAVYLLCSPHNPTGVVHTVEELQVVAAMSESHGVRVISDEIHAPLVLPGTSFVPYLSVEGAERGFALHSASKGWNLAGCKAALVVAGVRARQDLGRMPHHIGAGASHLGVIAHVAALRRGGEWLDAVRDGLAVNQRFAVELLGQELPEIRPLVGPGTYFAWLDCRALDLGDDPAAAFVTRGRVALTSGPAFGTGGAGHARLILATSQSTIREAVRRMTHTVAGSRSGSNEH